MKIVALNKQPSGAAAVLLSDGSMLDIAQASVNKNLTGVSDVALSSDILDILRDDKIDDVRALVEKAETASATIIDELRSTKAIVDAGEYPLLAPIPRPSFILAQGLAYRKHLTEMGVPLPTEPVSLIKVPSSVTGPGSPIILPKNHPDMVDWEGEFSIVIGKYCHCVSPHEAMDYVAGYTIINDVSARDWTAKALNPDQTQMGAVMTWGDNINGKQFPTFTPMGPVMVTSDEIPDPHDLDLKTTVNGKVMQQTNTSDLIFPIPQLISHFSQWYMFQPGDIISTGSPAGVGYGRKPQVFLKPGDRCDITVTGIGTLSNPVVSGR